MITKLWELGTWNGQKDTGFGYRIEMMWNEGEKECRESFEGMNVNKVLQNAMKFIIQHYKKKDNEG